MIDFGQIATQVAELRGLGSDTAGMPAIAEINIAAPELPRDELYFRKLVLWSYVLFFESGEFLKFSGNLLRQRRPDAFGKFRKLKTLIGRARTVLSHNVAEDAATRRSYDIWLLEVRIGRDDWEAPCRVLAADLHDVLSEVREEWRYRCENEHDCQHLWASFWKENETAWAAHEFDPLIAAAAESLGLEEFKSPSFRSDGARVDGWRKLAAYFPTREAAEAAVSRAICEDLRRLFGSPVA